jgi:integrase
MVRTRGAEVARHRLVGWRIEAERAVVKQIEDDVKTVHSSNPLVLDPRILELLKQHKQNSVFTALGDWVFASPEKHGNLPPSYTSFWEKLGRACQDAGIAHVSPHSFRHSYRAWLDELGTPITVQQRAMRHGDIRVTMNYGGALGEGLREASARVAAKAILSEWQVGSPKPLKYWGGRRESNPQRPEPQSGALPVELLPPDFLIIAASGRERACSS